METPRLVLPRHRPGHASGFSMIEMLMAAFILSIGLLGLLALFALTIRSGGQSRQRGTATLIAHGVLDRIAAEANLCATERWESGTSAVTSTGFFFINPNSLVAYDSPDAQKLHFDIDGNRVAPNAPQKVYTVSWRREPGTYLSTAKVLNQMFTVNVGWKEAEANVVADKYFSVSRNVRL